MLFLTFYSKNPKNYDASTKILIGTTVFNIDECLLSTKSAH